MRVVGGGAVGFVGLTSHHANPPILIDGTNRRVPAAGQSRAPPVRPHVAKAQASRCHLYQSNSYRTEMSNYGNLAQITGSQFPISLSSQPTDSAS
jgi:hypothetical protein